MHRAPKIFYAAVLTTSITASVRAEETKIPVKFTGGHEIGKNDYGRPVVLIAAALKVEPDDFREAFSGVTPARGRGPTGDEARRNKQALMRVLAPLKVTNDRLDEVSNYYRFRPQNGELWPTTPAEAYAVVEKSQIKEIVVTKPGAGYSSPPVATVKGFENVRFLTKVKYETDLKKNGGVESVEQFWEEDSPNSSQLPLAIREIQKRIQRKPYDEIRAIIIDRLGSEPRAVGSGVSIEHWDVAGGVLELHPWRGVCFMTKENRESQIHLQTTRNPARKNLIGGYEMTTLPEPPNGNRYWLGNIQIHPNLTYDFKQSGAFLEQQTGQTNNYFYAHPRGTVKIEYTKGASDDTLLESLSTGSVVASLHFQSADGQTKKTFAIKSNEPERRLEFSDSSPISFAMEKAWENWGQ